MISPGRWDGVRRGASRALGLIPLVVLVEGPAEKARELGFDLLDREWVADARRRRGGGLGLRGRRLGARRGRRLRGWRCGGWCRSRDRRGRRWGGGGGVWGRVRGRSAAAPALGAAAAVLEARRQPPAVAEREAAEGLEAPAAAPAWAGARV